MFTNIYNMVVFSVLCAREKVKSFKKFHYCVRSSSSNRGRVHTARGVKKKNSSPHLPASPPAARQALQTPPGDLWWSRDDVVGISVQMSALVQHCRAAGCLCVPVSVSLQRPHWPCMVHGLTAKFSAAQFSMTPWLTDRQTAEGAGETWSFSSKTLLFLWEIMRNVELWFFFSHPLWQQRR